MPLGTVEEKCLLFLKEEKKRERQAIKSREQNKCHGVISSKMLIHDPRISNPWCKWL